MANEGNSGRGVCMKRSDVGKLLMIVPTLVVLLIAVTRVVLGLGLLSIWSWYMIPFWVPYLTGFYLMVSKGNRNGNAKPPSAQ